MNLTQKQFQPFFCIIIVLSFVLSGCGQEEIQKLRSENEAQKNKIIILEQEISKLKETADYYYQQGVSFLSENKYEDAKVKFETVINKYPLNPLVPSAKQQLVKVKGVLAKIETQRIAEAKILQEQRLAEEIRRQEEEKYRPRSPEEAILEWKKFRNNEDQYKETVTTWRFRVDYFRNENPFGYLEDTGSYTNDYSVLILGTASYSSYQLSAYLGKIPVVKAKDWVVVTGKFQYVSSDNVVVLSPIRVKNEGFK